MGGLVALAVVLPLVVAAVTPPSPPRGPQLPEDPRHGGSLPDTALPDAPLPEPVPDRGRLLPESGEGRAAPPPGVIPSWCEPTPGGYRCLAGPIPVAGDQTVELATGVAAPSEAGWVTGARATLVDSSGAEVPPDRVHLHHAVWLNPHRRDMTCGSYDAGLPAIERFFASGSERTPLTLPDGYGYRWDPGISQPHTRSSPGWGMVVMLDGGRGQLDTFVELELDFVPADEATGMVPVDPVWLDVRNCRSDPVYDVSRGAGAGGVHHERWTYRMPTSGRFVFLGGHLHAGGLAIQLDDRTTGRELFTSRPTYGRPGHPGALVGMSILSDPEGPLVRRGDRLRLTAVYDSTRRREDVMGIMLGMLAPATDQSRGR